MSKHEYFECNMCHKNDEQHPNLEIFNFNPDNRKNHQLTPASVNDADDDFHICAECVKIIRTSDIMVGD